MVKLLGYEDLLRATELYSRLPQGCACAIWGGAYVHNDEHLQTNTHTHHLYSILYHQRNHHCLMDGLQER